MQLRKLMRLLRKAEKEYGPYIEVNIKSTDYKDSPHDYHYLGTVGIAECFKESDCGMLRYNPAFVVSLGIEKPNVKTYK